MVSSILSSYTRVELVAMPVVCVVVIVVVVVVIVVIIGISKGSFCPRNKKQKHDCDRVTAAGDDDQHFSEQCVSVSACQRVLC